MEPPGLFRGRGDHPKMGKLKARIYPRDITINIGEFGNEKCTPAPFNAACAYQAAHAPCTNAPHKSVAAQTTDSILPANATIWGMNSL